MMEDLEVIAENLILFNEEVTFERLIEEYTLSYGYDENERESYDEIINGCCGDFKDNSGRIHKYHKIRFNAKNIISNLEG